MRTHCKRDHELTEENTKLKKHKSGSVYRDCRTCEQMRYDMRRAERTLTEDVRSLYYNEDEGCAESPSCLSCPLPECIHDTPFAEQTNMQRNRLIYEGHLAGRTNDELQKKFGLGHRHIYRIIQNKGESTGQDTVGPEDEPGKPVEELEDLIKPHTPKPVMPENSYAGGRVLYRVM